MRRKAIRHPFGSRGDDAEGLTKDEDNTLRQLAFFDLAGDLSAQAQERMECLKRRDRRTTIRDPRPDPSNS
jgi:hypothetical protein